MRTINPTLVTGLGSWDADRLPVDEYEARIALLRDGMRRRGLDAAIVFGDALEHSMLAWLTGYAPWKSWAFVVVPLEEAPWVLVPGSERDLTGMRTQSWLPDMRSHLDWSGAVDPWLADRGGRTTVIGVAGADEMMPSVLAKLDVAVGGRATLVESEDLVTRHGLRPRELAVVEAAAGIAGAAADAALLSARGGAAPFQALVQAERAARLAGAQDVRVMIGVDGGRLFAPLASHAPEDASRLTGYVAVKYLGYWADAFVSDTPGEEAAALLGRLQGLLRPGAATAAIHREANASLGNRALHPALEGAFGRRIGLSLDEGGALSAEGDETVREGDVYSLAVGFAGGEGGFAGALALVTPQGARRLVPRPPRPTFEDAAE